MWRLRYGSSPYLYKKKSAVCKYKKLIPGGCCCFCCCCCNSYCLVYWICCFYVLVCVLCILLRLLLCGGGKLKTFLFTASVPAASVWLWLLCCCFCFVCLCLFALFCWFGGYCFCSWLEYWTDKFSTETQKMNEKFLLFLLRRLVLQWTCSTRTVMVRHWVINRCCLCSVIAVVFFCFCFVCFSLPEGDVWLFGFG